MSDRHPTLSHETRDFRWRRIRSLLARLDLDCVIVFGLKGRERLEGYLANEALEGVVIFPLESAPVLLTWNHKNLFRRQASKVRQEQFWIADARAGPFGSGIVDVLSERGLQSGRIGVVGVHVGEGGSPEGIVPFPVWSAVLDRLPNAEFDDITWEFRACMLEKNDEEIGLLRHSAAVGERACEAMLETVRPGASEFEICASIYEQIHLGGSVSNDSYLMMSWGADDVGWAAPTWTFGGGAPRIVQPGDLIMVEIFCVYGGLETQQQMSVAVAPVEPVIAELDKVTRRSYLAGLESARPGVSFDELTETMLGPIRDYGGWTLTPVVHSLAPIGWAGGMGLNPEKMPNQLGGQGSGSASPSRGRHLELKAGMPFALQPNCCKGQRRVNLGGTILVGADTPEELNSLPNRLHFVT